MKLKFNNIIFVLVTIIFNILGVSCSGKESSLFYPATTGKPFDYSRITDLIVFGDSYSDVSTDFTTMQYNGENYSLGKNWVLQLSDNFHPMTVWSFAISSSVIDLSLVMKTTNFSLTEVQYPHFLENMISGKKFDLWESDSTLFAIWFGINDIRNKNRTMLTEESNSLLNESMINSLFAKVNDMYEKGARNFVFINVPPFDIAPEFNNINHTYIFNDISEFNKDLQVSAESFSQTHSDVNVFVYDSNGEFISIIQNKSEYGFSVVDSYCPNLRDWKANGCLEPSNYFWVDYLHPLYKVHEILAKDLHEFLTENSVNKNNISQSPNSEIRNNSLSFLPNSSFNSLSINFYLTFTLLLILFFHLNF